MSTEAALRRELEGYERYGNEDRAAQVRAAIDALNAPVLPPEPISVSDDPETSADDPDAVETTKPSPKRARKARAS